MTLNLIGIGLNDEKDITVKGLELVKNSDMVYLESYTSMLQTSTENLEKFYGKKIILAGRELVEQGKDIIENAKTKNVTLLIIGDIFGATTHYDIYTRAKKENITVNLVHNTSIINAIGVTGLMLYNFGKTTSIPFPQENYNPDTAFHVIQKNLEQGLHTLILLDLKPDENKHMTVAEGLKQLLSSAKKNGHESFEELWALGCARIGGNFKISYGQVKELLNADFGKPPHCLVMPGKLHFVEEEALQEWT